VAATDSVGMDRRRCGPRRLAVLLLALSALCAAALPAAAAAASAGPAAPGDSSLRAPLLRWSYLTGDWGGRRARLEGRGLTVGAVYTGMAFSNRSGGLERGTDYHGNLDLTFTVDAERLGGWRGTTFFLYLLDDHGEGPSRLVGDAQGISNIAAPATFKVFEAWGQRSLLDNRLSLLFGLYDLSAEFDYLQAGALFIQSSFGTGPEFAMSGRNGPSIFPTTSLALRALYHPVPSIRLQAALLDGVPGDPGDPAGTHIHLGGSDGTLAVVEAGFVPSAGWSRSARPQGGTEGRRPGSRHYRIGREQGLTPRSRLTLGAWSYSAEFTTLGSAGTPAPERDDGNRGAYLSAQRYFRYGDPAAGRFVALFGHLGRAAARFNRFDASWLGGVTWKGFLPSRPDDRLGLGFATARNGRDYRLAEEAAGRQADRAETVIELTYGAALAPWLLLQPDLQYVRHPGTDPAVADSWVLGLAAQIAF
jgi:porin